MKYLSMKNIDGLVHQLRLNMQLKHEYGAQGIMALFKEAEKSLQSAVSRLKNLPVNKIQAAKEPDELKKIKALRPTGPRRMWKKFDRELYLDRLEGSFLARCAGCMLGAPVEGWATDAMENLARENGQKFPPTEYWHRVPNPFDKRYSHSARQDYTLDKMNGVPVDDDIVYTLLGLLVVEAYGPRFTIAQNGKAWLKYLPMACTAEHIALNNLKKKISADKAGATNNPYCEWIGADIRSDPWGYMAPAWPEFAADMAYRDAYLSHRRNGIYGEMFFSAAIAAAFAVKHPVEALEIALTEIPRNCAMAKTVRWALKTEPRIKNYRDAAAAVDKRFDGMAKVHTLNNACLTIWGLTIGGTNVSKVISETVAMGYDNDCTAATAGSIAGAIAGKKGVPAKWTKPFNNIIHSYLIKKPKFMITDLIRRFAKQAERVYRGG